MPRELVDVRGLDDRVPRNTQVAEAEIVREDEDDVGLSRRGTRRGRRGGSGLSSKTSPGDGQGQSQGDEVLFHNFDDA
jgi:hypothetical protein